MGVELWTNNAKSTLASGITDSALSLTVASGHGARFPSPTGGDYFFATLDDGANIEIVKCTARSTDTLTITRAQQGTSGTAFSTGTKVEIRVTKQSLSDLQLVVKEVDGSPSVSAVKTIRFPNSSVTDDGSGQVTIATGGSPADADYWVDTANSGLTAETVVGTTGITTAAYASRQAAAKAGRLFFPNDSMYIERDTGSAWAGWGPIYPCTEPDNSTFSDVNIGSAVVTTTYGGINMSCVSNGSAQSVHLRARSLAASSNYTVEFGFQPLLYYSAFSQAMVGLRDTGTDDAHFFVVTNDSTTLNFAVVTWNSNTSGVTGSYIALQGANMMPFPNVFVKFVDDGTNRKTSWSSNGRHWMEIHSTTRTNILTPDQLCFGVNPFSQLSQITLFHLKEF